MRGSPGQVREMGRGLGDSPECPYSRVREFHVGCHGNCRTKAPDSDYSRHGWNSQQLIVGPRHPGLHVQFHQP